MTTFTWPLRWSTELSVASESGSASNGTELILIAEYRAGRIACSYMLVADPCRVQRRLEVRTFPIQAHARRERDVDRRRERPRRPAHGSGNGREAL